MLRWYKIAIILAPLLRRGVEANIMDDRKHEVESNSAR